MPFRARPFRDRDYPAVLAFLRDLYRLAGPPVYATPGDLEWWRAGEEDRFALRRARLWLDEQRALAAFAWPLRANVDMFVHPAYPQLNAAVLAWAEQSLRAQFTGLTGPLPGLTAWSATGDEARVRALQDRGFSRQDVFFSYHSRPITAPIAEPVLPPGYSLTDMGRAADLEKRVEVHRDAFAPSRMTLEKYLRVRASTVYRPDLDLVAVAPDGAFAAFAIVWIDEENRVGVFEPVGTHSAHRRLGLARAVLHEGLRRLRALGARAAHVNSFHEDTAAQELYKSVGFEEIDRIYRWSKAV